VLGVNILWYNASDVSNQTNQAGYQVGDCDKTGVTATSTDWRIGVGASWTDVMLNWRNTF